MIVLSPSEINGNLDLIMTFYLIFKVVHIFAMVSWMAGMLYLPRIFVYHSNKNNSKEMNEAFVTMEYKLLKYIMNPAMIATWIFGILLLIHPYSSVNIYSFWFLVKFFCVILMTLFHAYYASVSYTHLTLPTICSV